MIKKLIYHDIDFKTFRHFIYKCKKITKIETTEFKAELAKPRTTTVLILSLQ
jgi:hypothetical protein